MYTEEDVRRLTWQSRRGMWELDLLLVPFMGEAFSNLELADQDRFVRLLDCEDQDLFLWFMQREVPPDEDYARIVGVVLAHVQSTKNRNKTL